MPQPAYNRRMSITVDADFLRAALTGYQEKRKDLDTRIEELRRRLEGNQAGPVPESKRTLSRAARQRIAAAQRKRWAAVRKAQAQAQQAVAAKKAAPLQAMSLKRKPASSQKRSAAPAARTIAAKPAPGKAVKTPSVQQAVAGAQIAASH